MLSSTSLSTIGNGALERRFQRCWEQLAANLSDTNTEAKAPRTITGLIKVKVDNKRQRGMLALSCTFAPVGQRVADRPVFLHMKDVGILEITEAADPGGQVRIETPAAPEGKVSLVDENRVDLIALSTIGGCALEERFQLLWPEIRRNLADPNTDPAFERSLTFTITVMASESAVERRETVAGVCELAMKFPKLAPPRVLMQPVFFSLAEPDRVVVSERDVGQRTIDDALTSEPTN